MDIFSKNSEGVQIQIKPLGEGKSQSFTIYNTSVPEVYNRIYNTFKAIADSDGEITITHYKTKNTEVKTNE